MGEYKKNDNPQVISHSYQMWLWEGVKVKTEIC